MTDMQSLADLCRPLSAKVQPQSNRQVVWRLEDFLPHSERPLPKLPPIVAVGPEPASMNGRKSIDPEPPAPPPVKPVRSRHDPALDAARDKVRALYDGHRTTARIALLSGVPRRTVYDYLVKMNLQPIKGQCGPSAETAKRKATLARRSRLKVIVANGVLSGPEIAAHFGVSVWTIHADCIALGIHIPKGTGKKGKIPQQAVDAAKRAAAAKRRAKREADALAAFTKAVDRAVAALNEIELGRDDIAVKLADVLRAAK